MKLLVAYMLAQLIHMFLDAFYAAASVNTRWQSVRHYLAANGQKLISQLVLSVAFYFVVLVENPQLLGSLGFGSLKIGFGLALMLGWFIDSLLDKLLGGWGLKREALGPPPQ